MQTTMCDMCCMVRGEPGKKNAPVVHKLHAAIAAARPTKARRASRVLNTDARAAKVRSNRRAITETTALGCKVRCAKNAAKPSMARTNAQVVRALHVAVQVGNSGPAICLLSLYALCGIATRHEPLDRQSFQRIGDNRRLVKRTMLGGSAVAQVVKKITLLLTESQASSRFLLGSHDKIIMHAHGTSLGGRICLPRDVPPKILPMSSGLQLAPIGAIFQHGKSNSSYVNTGEIPLKLGAQIRPVSISRLHDRVRVLTEMRRDDLGSWIQINGCSSRAAAAAPIGTRSRCAEHCAGLHLPGSSTMDGFLFLSVTMNSCTCSDSSAIATGRTSEDSVKRHRMIRRRRACYHDVKTLAAGRVLGDANERARSLASIMNT
jgi:hypothetical protein